MRCKKHPSDLSSSVGVCASCLRQRLFSLQSQSQSQSQPQPQLDDRRKLDPPPPPLLFPRSVSPYVTRRKSEHTCSHNIRFYSTPQVGPTSSTSASAGYKKKSSKFSIFSNLFRSRSDKYDLDLKHSDPCRDTPHSTPSSWFSTVFPTRRRKQSAFSHPEEVVRRDWKTMHRGMSPARGMEQEEESEGWSCGSEEWRKTPLTNRRTRNGQNRNVSGMAFCLSPLVRASPNRQWSQKSGLTADMGYSGEIRGQVKPHLSTAASFCANRSRKLADFGRGNRNR